MHMSMSELILIVGITAAVPMTFLWMAAHAYGLLKLGGNLSHISRRAGTAWLISGIGGFMGPLVIPMSVVSLVMALKEKGQDGIGAHTAVALRTVIAASVIILLMSALLVLAALGSLVLSA